MQEVADIIREYGEDYKRKHKLPSQMVKAINAIESCRTSKLGGHIDECDNCGHIKISYNSCRNRHCPKCQGLAKERWLTDRKMDLLPIQYFHMVFTIPDALNPMTLRNQKEIYSILFKSVSETLIELGKNPKYLGADIGFIGILHTWGQNLMDHPHIHCIAPGGGLSFDAKRWISTREEFFIPVKVLSRLFRGKFLFYLKDAYRKERLKFPGNIKELSKGRDFNEFMDSLYKKEWVAYSKPPFKNAEHVLEYLGRYTHRVAISNNRIAGIEDRRVTLKYRDYKDGNKNKLMTIEAHEFIRRFLLHILPDKFVKIRHYGILSNRNKRTKLKICKEILGISTKETKKKQSWQELLIELTGKDPRKCPCCGIGKMITKEIISKYSGKNMQVKKLAA